MYPCVETDDPDEGIPLLPCDIDCAIWWESCSVAFGLYLYQVLGGDYNLSLAQMCVNGSFPDKNGVPNQVGSPDYNGGRVLPSGNLYALFPGCGALAR